MNQLACTLKPDRTNTENCIEPAEILSGNENVIQRQRLGGRLPQNFTFTEKLLSHFGTRAALGANFDYKKPHINQRFDAVFAGHWAEGDSTRLQAGGIKMGKRDRVGSTAGVVSYTK